MWRQFFPPFGCILGRINQGQEGDHTGALCFDLVRFPAAVTIFACNREKGPDMPSLVECEVVAQQANKRESQLLFPHSFRTTAITGAVDMAAIAGTITLIHHVQRVRGEQQVEAETFVAGLALCAGVVTLNPLLFGAKEFFVGYATARSMLGESCLRALS